MRRFFGTVSTALLILLAAGGGIALAAELEIVPSPVGEGEQDLTINVWDFEPDTDIYVVPCDVPPSGEPDDVATEACDVANVATGTTDADGTAQFDVTWDVPAEGLAVTAGDQMNNEVATGIVEVTGDVGVLGTSTTADELPETGSESRSLVTLGVGLLALGGASVGTSRKLTPIAA